ncbi:hypothetical protein ATO3_27375 [Marinibacterium profundimaris]|uniref:Uncharacterized protein n=1 Tax=Marinibacterium profundimaris TaxID=1679460 RepID=A0A225NES5_9RHOB|nr:hypothetical protein ATO3_27375 [Marinibacterium profundimaris]
MKTLSGQALSHLRFRFFTALPIDLMRLRLLHFPSLLLLCRVAHAICARLAMRSLFDALPVGRAVKILRMALVLPRHCTGLHFIRRAMNAMPLLSLRRHPLIGRALAVRAATEPAFFDQLLPDIFPRIEQTNRAALTSMAQSRLFALIIELCAPTSCSTRHNGPPLADFVSLRI